MSKEIIAVDLFCGAGGLTHGFESAGLPVAAGYDSDPECKYAYEHNNSSTFVLQDVAQLSGNDIRKAWSNVGGDAYTLLAGCAPCQPFSNYTHARRHKDERWSLLNEFSRLVLESNPHMVTMENVPALVKHDIFKKFISILEKKKYQYKYEIVDCTSYGIPQKRKRLVLMASRLGKIAIPKATHDTVVTVQDVISHLPPLSAGEICSRDPLHKASKLSSKNLDRIRQSVPGGTWRDWDKSLVANCHTKTSGQRYGSVYGRMCWEQAAPTMTTLCYGFGNGRFGHPIQDRAISLREAAIFQTFPEYYQFAPHQGNISFRTVGKLIGNAVPVRLGEVIANNFISHLP